MNNTETMRQFDTIDQIKPRDVDWLKAGSTIIGRYVNNKRTILYATKRGITKGITCYICSDGTTKWRTWTSRNTSDGLTTEEARIFDPETYQRRMQRKTSRDFAKAQAKNACAPVKVGDIFSGSYGYDATLWKYYEVVSVSKSGKTVNVRELAHETAEGYGQLDWKCRPKKGCYRGDTERHKVQVSTYGNEPVPYIKIESFLWAYLDKNPTEWDSADNYH